MSLKIQGSVVAPMCGLFAELLAVDSVQPDDNFFQLGADSILAAELAMRIAEVFGVEIDDIAILENPTAIGLSGFLLQQSDDPDAVLAQLPDDEVDLLVEHLSG